MKGRFVPLTEEEGESLLARLNPNTPGAIPAGTRIRKINADDTDMNGNGSLGTVVSSIAVEVTQLTPAGFGYMIKWDDMSVPVFIGGHRIEVV